MLRDYQILPSPYLVWSIRGDSTEILKLLPLFLAIEAILESQEPKNKILGHQHGITENMTTL